MPSRRRRLRSISNRSISSRHRTIRPRRPFITITAIRIHMLMRIPMATTRMDITAGLYSRSGSASDTVITATDSMADIVGLRTTAMDTMVDATGAVIMATERRLVADMEADPLGMDPSLTDRLGTAADTGIDDGAEYWPAGPVGRFY